MPQLNVLGTTSPDWKVVMLKCGLPVAYLKNGQSVLLRAFDDHHGRLQWLVSIDGWCDGLSTSMSLVSSAVLVESATAKKVKETFDVRLRTLA